MELILSPEMKKTKWSKNIQQFIEKANNITKRKIQLQEDGKSIETDDRKLSEEFQEWANEVSGKESPNMFEIMKVLND